MDNVYDLAQEDTSEMISHSPEWKTLIESVTRLHDAVMIPFSSIQQRGVVVEDLIKSIGSILHPSGGVLIGVSGKSGYGKSTTINSLLHMRIAKAGAWGSQCTRVANEYCGVKQDQEEPFLAEVFFLSESERDEMLTALVHDYYGTANLTLLQANVATRANGNRSRQGEVVTALLALFQHQRLPDLKTADEIHQFFAQAKPGPNAAIVAELMEFTEYLILQHCGTRQTAVLQASTLEELLTQVRPFDGETYQGVGVLGSSMWRLVSKIRFHVESFLTEAGVSFLDTPELTDSPLAVPQHSQAMTHQMVVADPIRPFQDHSVRSSVREARLLGDNRVVVVITGSDRIDLPRMPKTSRAQKNAVAVRRIEDRVQELERWFEEELVSDTSSDVPAYCISNLYYEKYMEGFEAWETPLLTAEKTMVPDLRKYLASLPNEARLLGKKELLEVTIPSILDRLQVFASDPVIAAEGGELASLQQDLEDPLRMARGILEGSVGIDFQALWEAFN